LKLKGSYAIESFPLIWKRRFFQIDSDFNHGKGSTTKEGIIIEEVLVHRLC
jgi:hypothetical protein